MSSPFQALTKAVGGAEDVRVTFLESNSWMWQVAGVNLLVDPVMYTLDFGVPSLIQGKKNVSCPAGQNFSGIYIGSYRYYRT
jgi:hypothetical protein